MDFQVGDGEMERMGQMLNRSCATVLAVSVWLGLSAGILAEQNSNSEAWTSPKTESGHPDLQGVWDYGTITPLERPAEFAGQATLTDEDVAELEQRAADRTIDRAPPPGSVGGYNQHWFDRGSTVVDGRRTSLIVEPSDGRLPAVQPGIVRYVDADRANSEYAAAVAPVRLRTGGVVIPAGPEDRGLAERCLLGFNTGPPMISSAYNNNIQIFQNDEYVVIVNEMVHDVRRVVMDGRPHLSSTIRQWLGDSRGHWDGVTLVVETTNFTGNTASFNPGPTSWIGSGETLRLVERFTRTDDDSLLYEFLIDDSVTFTEPIRAVSTMSRNENTLFEYACHEGNYGLQNVLRGAREAERRMNDDGS
jgi:hypothetical protein